MRPGYHECPPDGCDKVIPNRLFACRADWYRLPRGIRDDINRTYRSGDDAGHLEATMAAQEWYDAHPKRSTAPPSLMVVPDQRLPLDLPDE
jgi:hypothetical protein